MVVITILSSIYFLYTHLSHPLALQNFTLAGKLKWWMPPSPSPAPSVHRSASLRLSWRIMWPRSMLSRQCCKKLFVLCVLPILMVTPTTWQTTFPLTSLWSTEHWKYPSIVCDAVQQSTWQRLGTACDSGTVSPCWPKCRNMLTVIQLWFSICYHPKNYT